MTHTEQNLAAASEPPARRKLPIGIQTFRTIREEEHYYVDKTPFIRRLVDEVTHYFLSRPRRFGKSLLVDTVKKLFEGSEALFRGLRRPRSLGLVDLPGRCCASTSAAASTATRATCIRR